MKKFVIVLAICIFGAGVSFADGYKIGDKASDFKLKNVDGKFVSLKDYKDAKGFVVIFTCNECPVAKLYEDRIIELNNKYSKKGFPVIAINPNDPDVSPDDTFEKMQIRAQEKEFTFPYLYDDKHEVYKKYGATKTPHVYLLNKEKDELLVSYIGAIDDNSRKPSEVSDKFLESAINAVLTGSKPNPELTKAVGCSVKYKK